MARLRRGRALATLVWRSGRWRVVPFAALTVLSGLLPIVIIVATGSLLAAVPGAVDHGLDSPSGRAALWSVAAVTGAFVALGVGSAATDYLCRVLDDRYALVVHETVARAMLDPPGVEQLEDPVVADRLALLDEVERDGLHLETVASLRSVVAMRVEGIAACVLLVSFAWWAPLLLAGGWTLASQALSRWVQRGIVDTTVRDPAHAGLRRAKYSRSLAMDPLAAKEVRVFGLAGWVVERYASTWQAAMRAIWRERVSNSWQVVFAVVAVTAAHAVVLGVLGAAVVRGEVSLAMLAVYALAVLATERLGLAGDPQWRLARATVAAELLRELAGRLIPAGGPVRPDVRAAGTGPPAAVELRLEAVRFTYRGRERPVLADLDLVVPPGQSLAVVGENGAGKTTLVKLICGLYQPAAGRLVIDGVPLAGSDMAAWRRRVGVIFQDFVRYQLPLRANVGFGDTAITDDAALARALRDAGGADLVEQLPAGWDTVLSTGYDGGVDLSGGQWQKVALARALLAVRAGAGLLILDEPTANLDVTAEAELFDRFLNLTRGVTTILVSHRLSSVRHADRIVLLHDGRIAEDGSHDELLAAGGRYATLFRLQAERFAAAPAGAEAPGDRRNGGGHG